MDSTKQNYRASLVPCHQLLCLATNLSRLATNLSRLATNSCVLPPTFRALPPTSRALPPTLVSCHQPFASFIARTMSVLAVQGPILAPLMA